MKRRNFLKIFSATSVTPFVVNGHSFKPFANTKMAKILSSCDGVEERVLVLVQLKGGNDGLNAVIPIPQYDAYMALRPNIGIPEADLIKLDTTLPNGDQIGLHPAMLKVKELYDKGWASIVQGAGYQSMNQSHFKGTDLWLSGGDTTSENINISTGWMGRALQAIYPDVLGAPTTDMPDPLGIQVGDSNISLGFHTETEHQNALNLSGQDPSGFYSLIQTIGGAPVMNIPDSEQGEQIEFIMGVERSVSLYAQRITSVFNAGTNSITDYPVLNGSTLGAQLKTIARLIKGGCKTKIYLCQLGGFDTHGAQVDSGTPTTGDHALLLQYLSESVDTFLRDLDGMGIADQVVACTFSEFGRCAKENGSDGTDHGTLSPMMLFGKNINAGVLGTNVNLSNLTADNQLQGVQHDYRQVFASLLQDWLGADNMVMEEAMFDGYAKLNVIDTASIVSPDCYLNGGGGGVSTWEGPKRVRTLALFPNPASINVEITYTSKTAFDARITLHSLGGALISGSTVRVETGENLYFMDVSEVPSGIYFVRIENKTTGAGEALRLNVVR